MRWSLVLLLMAVMPSVAAADVRSSTQTDPQDAPRSALDLSSINAALDRDAGTLTVTFGFYAPIPDPKSYGSLVRTSVVHDCDHTFGDGAGSAEIGFSSTYGLNTTSGTSQYHWAPTATAYGAFGSRSPPAEMNISPDRMSATVSFSDPLLVGTGAQCVVTKSSWAEAPSDPNSPPGAVQDELPPTYFEGIECVVRPAIALSAPPKIAYGVRAPVKIGPGKSGTADAGYE